MKERRTRRRPQPGAAPAKGAAREPAKGPPDGREIIDRVEEAGVESFPASDPPSWTP